MRKLFRITAVVIILMASTAAAEHPHKERYYQEKFCAEMGGKTEVRLADGCRVDCLTRNYAIEVDFALKWAEAIGQALYYADQTHRKPGILLVMTGPSDGRFLARLNSVAEHNGITVWIMP